MTHPRSHRLFAPRVVLASPGWVALIVAGAGLQAEQFIEAGISPIDGMRSARTCSSLSSTREAHALCQPRAPQPAHPKENDS